MPKKEDYEYLVKNLPKEIGRVGQKWEHTNKDDRTSRSQRVDKHVGERIKDMVIRIYKPKTSVLSSGISNPNKMKSTRDIVSVHIDNKWCLRLDIEKYYESIKFEMVQKALLKCEDLPQSFLESFYFDNNRLRRGLFASPFISEIVGSQLDSIASKALYELGLSDVDIKYSRYYDDMLFSSNDIEQLRRVEVAVSDAINVFGLSVNTEKSKIIHIHTSKLLGLRIHNGQITVSKKFKKKARLRMYYADYTFNTLDSDSEASVDRTLKALGTAIGSIQYIVHNSPKTIIDKYEPILQKYYEKLSVVKDIEEELRDAENPICS